MTKPGNTGQRREHVAEHARKVPPCLGK
jgi:hypothetical protein